jgi:hypothetical protein
VRPLGRKNRSHPGDVQRITTAPRSRAEDQHARFVKYTVSMSVRMVCLVLALVVTGPLRWVFIAGAVVLPYVAVVIANASSEQAQPAPESWTFPTHEIGPGGDDDQV